MDYLTLREELLYRFREDQELSRQKAWTILEKIYDSNAQWLAEILNQIGWPDEQRFGIEGEQAAWLIAQHASDTLFQERCLQLLQRLPPTQERLEYVAYLTDSILVKKGEQQLYGTQFSYGEPSPIADRKHLDERRRTIGLEPFLEYYQRMKQSF